MIEYLENDSIVLFMFKSSLFKFLKIVTDSKIIW